jgi:hypothetical protein
MCAPAALAGTGRQEVASAVGTCVERDADRRPVSGARQDAQASSPDGVATGHGVPLETERTSPWARSALAAVWAVVILGAGAGLHATADQVVARLVSAPRPAAYFPAVTAPAASEGERALAEARRLLEAGDAAAAARALDRVAPDEPAYPFAQRLRQQVSR